MQRQPRREHHQRGPQRVGGQQVRDLHPQRGQQHHVEQAQRIDACQQQQDQRGEAAIVPVRSLRCAARTSSQMRKMLARKATVGCVQRQRTSQPLAEKSPAPAPGPSEVAGKSVSPSAASEPVTPTIITTTMPATAPKGATQADAAAQIALARG